MTDDTISRQAAIDCCRNEWEEEVAERIEALPSAQPKHTEERTETHACDCISRQAAIDGKITAVISGQAIEAIPVTYIKNLPSAQPEIIRCRDCKHYHYADIHIPQEQMCTCEIDGNIWSPDSYCSFAERRTNGVDN